MNTKSLYTEEQDAWLREHWSRYGGDAVQMFNEKFGQHRTYQGIRSHCERIGIRVSPDLRRKRQRENNKRHNPIGAVKMRKGYLYIKVTDEYGKSHGNWELYHRYVYKQAHGEIPKDKVIIFLDGDHGNCSIDNLIAVPQSINTLLMKKKLRSVSGELTRTGIEWCKLYQMLQEDGYFDRERERELELKKVKRYADLNSNMKRAVYKCDTDGNVIARYDGISEAARAEYANASHISACARGKRHTCKGYRWIYEEE